MTQPPVIQSAKLTNWKNEPGAIELKSDFEVSKSSHDALKLKINRWRDLLNITGSAKPKTAKGRSSVQPKLIRRQAEWRYSALTEPFLGSKDMFKVSPVTFEDGKGSEQNQLVLNYQWRTKINKVKFIDEFVRATVDEGTSITRVGWKRVTKKIKQTVPVYAYYELESEEQVQQFQQALEAWNDDPRTFKESQPPEIVAALEYYDENGQPVYAEQDGEEEVEVEKLIINQPVYDLINPDNFYLDPTCNGDISKALFAIVSFETCKADLLKEPNRYKNLDNVDWASNTPITNPDHSSNTPTDRQFNDDLRKKVVAYEYWGFYDIDGNGELVPIVATWIGNTVIRMEKNPYPDQKLPFVLVPYLPVKREAFGETDAELLEDNQKILGAITRGMIDLLGRSANSQMGMAKGMLDPLNRRRFDNGQDYEFNPQANPHSNIIEHKYPELPQSAMIMLNLQNNEAEALTGVKAFGGGLSAEAYGDVAAGIRGILDAASKREMAILRRLAKGISEIGAKTISMNAVFLPKTETVRITNQEFVQVNRDDLQGDYDTEVDISTAEIDNQKSQDLAYMLQTIGPNTDTSIVMEILAQICELKRMPELAHKLRTWKPPVDPVQEQLKQFEVQKAQKEVEKLQSEIDLNKAKAKQASSMADMTDLSYVERETGTEHAREMQKQAGQARGNQDLEVTKALLKPTKPDEKKPDVEAGIGYNELSRRMADDDAHPTNVDNLLERNALAQTDPSLSISSKYYDPSLDPASNQNLNI